MFPGLGDVTMAMRIKVDQVCTVKMAFGGTNISAIRGIKSFDTMGDASVVSVRWRAWLEEFESYADRRGLFLDGASPAQRAQRRALLLFNAGAAVRETFKMLHDTGEKENYEEAVRALNGHYIVKTNATFQHHVFRQVMQTNGETVA